MSRRITLAAAAVALCWAFAAALCEACENPVWEYAMLNWRQHPHRVFYLHEGAEKPGDAAVNRRLEKATDADTSHANLLFRRLDVTQIDGSSPREFQALAKRYAALPLPTHVVLTPRWVELHVGRLRLRDARALVDSPKRRELARLLCEGKQGVLVLLSGTDETQNDTARDQVREAIEAAREYEWDVGLLEVGREVPEEKWLVRQLLRVDAGLDALKGPMVFGAFGRGHVEGPHVGEYITASYVLDLIAFMNGPCNCVLNPLYSGLDLLTTWDWEAHVQDWVPVAERPDEAGGFVTF